MRTVGYSKWEVWHFLGAFALGAIAIAVCWQAWKDIHDIAQLDEEQSHIFLVPVVAVWMVWARRKRLRNCPPGGTFVGPIIAAVGAAASVIGYDHAIQSLWHLGAVLLFIGAVLTTLGKNVLFQFLPAFAVLAFLVPIPGAIRQAISIPLQTATASVTEAILDLCGVPLTRSGNVLKINGMDVAVAEACNGMRMVFALLLVAYAFAFSIPLRNTTRFFLLLFSPAAALFCNVLRLIPTTLIYGYMERSTGDQFHDWSGWLMLPVAFFLLMGVVKALKWALIPVMRYNLAYQ
jgi:exosortase